jgi:hypothetical protein
MAGFDNFSSTAFNWGAEIDQVRSVVEGGHAAVVRSAFTKALRGYLQKSRRQAKGGTRGGHQQHLPTSQAYDEKK